jgi:hypothetical protein
MWEVSKKERVDSQETSECSKGRPVAFEEVRGK